MVAFLLSPNRCHQQIARVKDFNLNETEVQDSDIKNAFPGIFNFAVGILVSPWTTVHVRPNPNPIYHPLTMFLVFSKSLKSTEKGEVSKLILNSGSEVTNAPTIARLLARNSKTLYSDDLLTSSEIDHFIRLGQGSTDLGITVKAVTRQKISLSNYFGLLAGKISTVKLKIPEKAFSKSGSRFSVTFKLQFLTLVFYQWQRLGLSKYANMKKL